ncbi:MAG: EAL domain-containing protein, partial [Nitrococcus sp.]|nr:EAL domain-containing protein [Nitrococcus sp.]
GLRLQDITPPDDLAINLPLFEKGVRQGMPYLLDKRYIRPDGSHVWVSMSSSPIRNGDGEVVGMAGVALDITKRKRSEALVEEQNRLLELIARGEPLGHCLNELCLGIERLDPKVRACVLMAATDRSCFTRVIAPRFPKFAEALLNVPLGAGWVGTCTQVVVSGAPVVCADVANDPRWHEEWRSLCLTHAIRAGYSLPIVAAEALPPGSVFLCFDVPKEPSEWDRRLAEMATATAGIALRREQAEQSLREHAQRLREAEAGYRTIFEHAVEGIYRSTWEGRFIQLNPAMVHMLGYTTEQEALAAISDIATQCYVDPRRRETLKRLLGEQEYVERFISECYRPATGERLWVEQNLRAVRNDAGELLYIQGTAQDITEQKRDKERIQYLARHDDLTELPNRREFKKHLGQALTRAGRRHSQFAVLFIDLDRFKDINDSRGHEAGDKVLIAVAGRLAGALRHGDYLARLSGDEFGVVIEDVTDQSTVMPFVHRLLEQFERPLEIDGMPLAVTASIGVFVHDDDSEDADQVLSNADMAMYQAKLAGRSTYRVFEPEMDSAGRRRLTVEAELRSALERGQLSLAVQPQIELASGRVIAAEVLLRWQHPELGLVSPLEFIPIAEQTRLIVPIGAWVIERVCALLARPGPWQRLTVFANLSAVQFMESDIEATVTQALRRYGVGAERLGLEITESVLMRCLPQDLDQLMRLHRSGVSFAFDDFGTGFSSLAYLRQFPVRYLKIDKSFVQGASSSESDRQIVAAIASLARNLGLETVAEGTEEIAQARAMAGFGCDRAQGFCYTKPLPVEEFEAFLGTRVC